jgi:hypothetical protein
MRRTEGTADIYRSELVLRDRVEHAYAEARRLVFDVVDGPLDCAALTPRQVAVLEEFHTAEAELNVVRYERRNRVGWRTV